MTRRRNLPNLNDVVAFEAAARTGGFTQAAQQLNVQQPAISRRIALLEDWLGTSLFQRRGPSLKLTDSGRAILPTVEHALSAMETGFATVRRPTRRDTLAVSVSISFAGCYLIDRLPGFLEEHPKIEVQVVARYTNEPAMTEESDVFIYFKEEPGPSEDRLIFGEDLIAVCAPSYLEKTGPIDAPEDLLQRTLLVLHEPAHVGDWTNFLALEGLSPPDPRPSDRINNFVVYLNAVLAGRGVGLAWRELVTGQLESGQLVQPVETVLTSDRGYYMRHSGRREAVTFADWIAAIGDADSATENARPG